jgi:hypothetical protein
MNPGEAAKEYLAQVRQIRSSGHQTDEQSFYPALNHFIDALLDKRRPTLGVLGHPHAIQGDLPDLALYEIASNVLVLPFEVKPAAASMSQLVASDQARRYARSFGGGQVLLTNQWQFVLARQEGDSLVIVDEVALVADETQLDQAHPDFGKGPEQLLAILDQASQVRGNLFEPQDVAGFLAYHAGKMRDAIASTASAATALAPIRQALHEGLQIELADELLVPTVVQTLVYGLFAAWLDDADPTGFDWMDSAYRLEVPVFAEVLYAALRPALIRRCNLKQHLDAVARVLMWTDRSRFVDRFDGGAIEYFYEPFLREFDATLRGKLGVWYTPREIAEYQVARADHHLKADLGIADGIADLNVIVLDPACGTGTYLAAVLRYVLATHLANHEPLPVAVSRVREAALNRIIGFEILPAAFIISHLHISRLLKQMGTQIAEDERLRVYLTNSLTGWASDAHIGSTLFPELEEELHEAGVVKRHEKVLVILGNPPYEGYSSAESDEEKALIQPWIAPLWPVWHVGKHRLNDLYVRFWKVAIEKIADGTGRGIVTFISNRKWLGGRSYPTMREAVVHNFDNVVVDDLHGSLNDLADAEDGSVFTTAIAGGIKLGTAIVTATRTGPLGPDNVAAVSRRDFRGSGSAKRGKLVALRDLKIDSDLQPITVSKESRWRFAGDAGDDFPSLDEYLTFFLSGVQPVRDEAVIAFDQGSLVKRMKDYFNPEISWANLIEKHPGFGVTRARYNGERTRVRLLGSSRFRANRIVPFLYRPFDVRFLYWETQHKLLNEARAELLPYWLAVPGQRCIVIPQTPRRPGAFRPLVSKPVASFACAEPDARLFALYKPGTELHGLHGGLEVQGELPPPTTCVSPEWIAAARTIGAEGTDEEVGEQIFYALVAVMNAPAWISAQPVDADDFAPVPLPSSPEVFGDAVTLGRRIADLDDPTVEVPGVTTGAIDPGWAGVGVPDSVAGNVTLVFGRRGSAGGKRKGDSVMWDTDHGWQNIPDAVWSFTSVGHTVLPKWLSYRVGTHIGQAEREAFMKVCRRISAIQALEPDCDKVYAEGVEASLMVPIAAS